MRPDQGTSPAFGEHAPFRLAGIVLPEGRYQQLWVVGGRISTTPIADASTLATDVWIMPGLVDAHCHIGLDAGGAVPPEIAEQQAVRERDAGVLLIRDAGSPADTHWIDDRADLPVIIRAGRHIARTKRYLRNFGDEVEPGGLLEAVERQVRAGDGWIKLVGDWIDRDLGDLAPLWPREVLAAAIERAHQLGARVTAHVFGEEALPDLLAAGIDGIEHGTGLSEEIIALMADRQVALVPTLVQLENFESFAAAGEVKFPRYARHIRALYASRLEVFGAALDAGVPIYAGTDAGGVLPHGMIGAEVEALARLGGPDFALGAASWRARAWLGRESALAEGAQADLLIFDADPRTDIKIVRHPRWVVLRGTVRSRAPLA